MCVPSCNGATMGEKALLTRKTTVSPMSLLQNPMILLAVVGMGLMFGMPYLIDSSKSLLALSAYFLLPSSTMMDW